MVDKLIRDGQVAVLISPGWGAGWSTWSYGADAEALVFDPDIARAVLGETTDETPYEIAERKYPDAYAGGIDGLEVRWVPEGASFDVNEYDGNESLVVGDRRFVA